MKKGTAQHSAVQNGATAAAKTANAHNFHLFGGGGGLTVERRKVKEDATENQVHYSLS